MIMNENILYTYMKEFGGYFQAEAIKCDVCDKIFKVKKGFFLIDGFIKCYKHFKEDNERLKKLDQIETEEFLNACL